MAALQADLDELEAALEEFRAMEPAVLVSPFRGGATNFATSMWSTCTSLSRASCRFLSNT
ncbi:MAG: hypothetical protein ACRDWA_06455 [Acidimicrobiia bacterium]